MDLGFDDPNGSSGRSTIVSSSMIAVISSFFIASVENDLSLHLTSLWSTNVLDGGSLGL